MALRDRKNKLKPLSDMGYSCIDRGTMYVTGENLGFTNGYISVLKKDTFTILEDKEADEREVVSFEPVKPVDNIEISSEILELLENIKYDIKD
jgi:hypothetical protein